MSSSTYYNFMTTTTNTKKTSPSDKTLVLSHKITPNAAAGGMIPVSLEANRRRSTMSSSPFANCSSFSSSSNTSNSSLNQFNSLTQTNSANSQNESSPSSNCSSSSVASSSNASSTPITSSNILSKNQHQLKQQQQHYYGDLQRKSSINMMSPISMIQSNINSRQNDHLSNSNSNSTSSSSSSSQMFHSYTLHSLEPKPFKPFKTKSDYIEAMKEDLAEWLNQLYPDLDLTTENFFSQLETGAIICRHANNVTLMGRNLIQDSSLEHNDSNFGCSNGSGNLHEPNNNNTNIHQNHNHQQHHRANSNSPMSSTSSNDYSLCSSSTTTTTTTTTKSILSPRQSITSLSRAAIDINWFWVKMIPYKEQAKPGTFFARDNICQFILWCRSLNILECLLFETDDLVARKNEKSFILCLLEVARIGFKVGMPTPLIIQLEQEIDREIEEEAKFEAEKQQNQDNTDISSHLDRESCCDLEDDESNCRKTSDDEADKQAEEQQQHQQQQQYLDIEKKKLESSLDGTKQSEEDDDGIVEEEVEEEEEEEEEDYGPKPQVITNDLVSLHEKVVQLLCQCTCPTQFPMVRVGDNGKYKIGDKLIIFVRILRRHIMVRVGGGWQELSEFLRAKDPCRSKLNFNHHHNHHHSTASVSPLSSHHPTSNNNIHQHHGSQSIRQTSFSAMSRSRLQQDNSQLLDGNNRPIVVAGHHHHHHQHHNSNSNGLGRATIQRANSPASSLGRQRFISGSASMSWISNNS